MKKYINICIALLFFACDSENANDCFQKAGNIVTQEVDVPFFTKIKVNRDVALILKEGPIQKVIVQTGQNLINDVTVNVVNEQLRITENNTCNFVRDYNITKVYITAPNITEINSSTQFKISSDGILSYPELAILSEDYTDSSVIAVGEIELNLSATSVRVVGNNLTTFTLTGVTENLSVSLAAGDGRFHGGNLVANNVTFFHRGTNKLIVNPQSELRGTIVSTGNVIAKNHPPTVVVEELYTGRLIFE